MAVDQQLAEITERVCQAAAVAKPLCITGSGSRDFIGCVTTGDELGLAGYSGIIKYRPEEMVVTVKAGTKIQELHQVLAEQGQYWRSQPPCPEATSTAGGAVSCGLSGPGLPWSGGLRGEVLGVRILDGRGRLLRFGGEVIKNVAGYDLARLLVGAMGTLGVLLDISLRVFPQPEEVFYGYLQPRPSQVASLLASVRAMAIPLAAMSYCATSGTLRVKLEGSAGAIAAANHSLKLLPDDDGAEWWQRLRDLQLDFFKRDNSTLWLIQRSPGDTSVPRHGLLDQCGARLWQYGIEAPATTKNARCIPFRQHDLRMPLQPPADLPLLQRLKAVLDPQRILNPGRLHPQL